MSEISRDMNTSTERDMKMDLFQYYIHGVRELISSDDFSPSLTNPRLANVGNGSSRRNELEKEENCPVGFSSLFCNAVGDGLSAHRKDRLVSMLCRTVVALNAEVDEMLDPVFSMLRLRSLLAPEKAESEERERKRFKVNEPLNVSTGNVTEEGSLSGKKGVIELEPSKCKSLTRCNNPRCGKHAQKSSFDETKSLCWNSSKQGMNESFLGSTSRDKENGEVSDVFQVLLENRGPKVVEKMAKHSADLFKMLEQMKEKLEELVDTVVASCRAMTLAEKHQLRKLVQNLDPQNLDRVVEIIQRGKPPEKRSTDDVTINLQNEDNSTLWRIYFHVKAVENAKKLL